MPSLVLFLGLGMLVGSDGLGWIGFDNYRLARTIGVISLALILFEGGLTGGLLHLRPVLGAATSLATVGTAASAVVVGFAAVALFGFSTEQGLASAATNRVVFGVLADGRYAITGPLVAIGSRSDLSDWARRRMRTARDEERAWLQTVTGPLAADRSR